MLRTFVADAAHELHTPLTALQANLELARDEHNASARTRYLSRAQEQGQRLEALVQGLLDLSRIESAETMANFEPVNLTKLLGEIVEPYASRAEQSNRTLELDLPTDRIEVSGTETLLRQAFENLLENALKFTRPNDFIRIATESDMEWVSIKIIDSGIGIPTDDLPRIFSRFHRGRNVSKISGNGLGLAIVKAIITLHGGTVDVQSQSARGTTITVSLPSSIANPINISEPGR